MSNPNETKGDNPLFSTVPGCIVVSLLLYLLVVSFIGAMKKTLATAEFWTPHLIVIAIAGIAAIIGLVLTRDVPERAKKSDDSGSVDDGEKKEKIAGTSLLKKGPSKGRRHRKIPGEKKHEKNRKPPRDPAFKTREPKDVRNYAKPEDPWDMDKYANRLYIERGAGNNRESPTPITFPVDKLARDMKVRTENGLDYIKISLKHWEEKGVISFSKGTGIITVVPDEVLLGIALKEERGKKRGHFEVDEGSIIQCIGDHVSKNIATRWKKFDIAPAFIRKMKKLGYVEPGSSSAGQDPSLLYTTDKLLNVLWHRGIDAFAKNLRQA